MMLSSRKVCGWSDSTRTSRVARGPYRYPASVILQPGINLMNGDTASNFYRPSSVARALGDKEESGRDWDSAWSRFQRQMKSQVDTNGAVRPRAPRRAPGLSPQQDRVRQQERFLLDIYTNENFYKLGAVAAVALIVVCIASAGS